VRFQGACGRRENDGVDQAADRFSVLALTEN
jgi:hypothetical protein